MNFRDYFEINDRQYGKSDPDDDDNAIDVANLTRYDSGIELIDDVSRR